MNLVFKLLPLLLFSFSAFGLTFSPSELVSGIVTKAIIMDGTTDVTKNYTVSSTDVSVVVFSGTPYVKGDLAGEKTIQAKSKTDGIVHQFAVTVFPGQATRLTLSSGNLQKAAVGTELPLPLKVKAVDNAGNGVANVSVNFTSSSSTAVITGSPAVTDNEGVAHITYRLGSIATNERITATGPSSLSRGSTVSFTETALSQPVNSAAKLFISVSPITVKTNDPFSVTVKVLDSAGEVSTNEPKLITITAHKNNSCSLSPLPISGGTSATSINGVADFSGISYSEPAYLYIKASASGLTSACSQAVVIQSPLIVTDPSQPPPGPSSIVFSEYPQNVTAGKYSLPQIKGQLLNAQGFPFNYTTSVRLSSFIDAACSIPSEYSLSGNLTVSSSLSYATFLAISYPIPGTIYLKMSADGVSTCSQPIVVHPDPSKIASHLQFSPFSTTAEAMSQLSLKPKVSVMNGEGGILSSPSFSISINAYKDSNCTIPAEGTSDIEPNPSTTINGVASFNKMSYSKSETIYYKATTGQLSKCSQAVTYTDPQAGRPYRLIIIQSPSGEIKQGEPISTKVKAEIRDVYNNKTSITAQVSVQLHTDSECLTPTNIPSKTTSSSSGIASFELEPISDLGNYYVKVYSGALESSCSPSFSIIPSCEPGFHQEGLTCVSDIKSCYIENGYGQSIYKDGSYGSCTPVSCNENYSIEGTVCSPSICSPSDVSFSESVMGNKVDGCVAVKCVEKYAVDGAICVEKACEVSDVPNSTFVTGTLVSGCFPTSCEEKYKVTGNTCSPEGCEVSDILKSTLVSGDRVYGCKAESCESGYEPSSDLLSCIETIVSCSKEDASENGWNTENSLTYSGNKVALDVTQCEISSCVEGFHVENSSCQPNEITCSENNGSGTKTWNGTSYGDCALSECSNSSDTIIGNKCFTVESFQTFKGLNGQVNTIERQSDDKLIVGGSFTHFNNAYVGYIARINPDGTLDQTFNLNGVGFNNTVEVIKVSPSGEIYVGGSFTSYNGISNNANRIAKLNSDGTINQTFSNNLDVTTGIKQANSGFNSTVKSIELDSSSSYIIVGGQFSTFKTTTNNAKGIAKLSIFGAFDSAFSDRLDITSGTKATSSGFNGTINSLKLDSTNNIYVAGGFNAFAGSSVKYVAKLLATGSPDTAFNNKMSNGLNITAHGLDLDSSRNVYVVGSFVSYGSTPHNARGVAKFNSSGDFDNSFSNKLDSVAGTKTTTSGFSNQPSSPQVNSIKVVGTHLYIGTGSPGYRGGTNNSRGIVKLSTTGDYDVNFSNSLDVAPGTKTITSGFSVGFDSSTIRDIETDSSGNIYVGGPFVTFKNSSANHITKLSPTGSLLSFIESRSGVYCKDCIVKVAKTDSNNNIYIGGSFSHYNGKLAMNIAKVKPNGDLDESFNTGTGISYSELDWTSSALTNQPRVNAIAIHENSIYLGGRFRSYKGTNLCNANSFLKISSDGEYDHDFMNKLDKVPGTKDCTNSGFWDGEIHDIKTDSLGSIYVVGKMNRYLKGQEYIAPGVAKFNSAGDFDYSFSNNLDTTYGVKNQWAGFGYNVEVSSLELTSDGNLIIGGSFTKWKDSISCNRIAKLSNSGVFDSTFNSSIGTGFDNSVLDLEFDSSGNIIASGYFSSFNGVSNNARGIAKVSATGIFDQAFSDNLDVIPGTKTYQSGFGPAGKLAIDQSDNIYISATSQFKGIANNARGLAKLNANGVFDQTFSDNLDVISGIKSDTSGYKAGPHNIQLSVGITLDNYGSIISYGAFGYFKETPVTGLLKLFEDGNPFIFP